MKLIEKTYTGMITNDPDTGDFVIFCTEAGGPIISMPDLEKAKEEFNKALSIANACVNLVNFVEFTKQINGEPTDGVSLYKANTAFELCN
jgi:hypothetical protein